MAFTGNGTKLVGDDGFLQNATFGAEVLGDGVATLAVGTYLIINVAGTSAFPAPASGGTAAAAGDILVVKTGDVITPATDDDVVTLTLTDQCDVTSWVMEFSSEEIDTTTLCDTVKTYRKGKSDMSGTLAGVYTVGLTNDKDGKFREFIDIAEQDGDASFDRFEQQENILLGTFFLNNDSNKADEQYIVANYQLFGQGAGGELGSAQTFSSPFRFASSSYTVQGGSGAGNDISIKPTLYRLGDGS